MTLPYGNNQNYPTNINLAVFLSVYHKNNFLTTTMLHAML